MTQRKKPTTSPIPPLVQQTRLAEPPTAREQKGIELVVGGGPFPPGPTFVLQPWDEEAPGIIEEWARRCREKQGDSDKVRGAVARALEMRAYQARHGAKTPD